MKEHSNIDPISKEVKQRLNEHDLLLIVNSDEYAPDPLESGIGTTYGPLEDMTDEHFEMSVQDTVKDYCENTLGCTVDDIIWRVIEVDYKEDSGGLAIEQNTHLEQDAVWENDRRGFVFIKKSEALTLCNTTEMTDDVERFIELQFKAQMASYAKWGEMMAYDIEVVKKGVELPVKFTAEKLYDLDGYEQNEVNALIDINAVAHKLIDKTLAYLEKN